MKVNKMKKALSILLTLIMVVGMMPVVSFEAEATSVTGMTLYLKPNSNWKSAGARFAAYFFKSEGNVWNDMTDSDSDGVYEVEVPEGDWTNVIFCRMDPSKTENNWDNKWNQTGDLTLSSNNTCYTVPEGDGNWDCGTDSDWKHFDDGTGKCSACGGYVDGIGATLAGYSLSLAGNIGVNFYMELSAEVVANEAAYMQFTLPNGNTSQVTVAQATQETVSDKTYYVFSCEVAAKEMTKDIKAQMVVGENVGTEYTYTVKEYADAILTNPANYTTEDKVTALSDLVKAMLDYGAYSQKYFTPTVADEELANYGYDSTDLSGIDSTDLAEFKYSTDGTATSISDLGSAYATLELESKTALNVYYTPGQNVTNISTSIDDVSVSEADGKYVMAVSDIVASGLDTAYTFYIQGTVGDTEKTWSMEYSALSYCYTILDATSGTYSDALVNVSKTLYLYNVAANTYFAN